MTTDTQHFYGGVLESASGEWDENGYHFRIAGHGANLHVRVCGVEEARELLAAVEPLRGWIAEHDYERACYAAATPEERDRVLRRYTVGEVAPLSALTVEAAPEAVPYEAAPLPRVHASASDLILACMIGVAIAAFVYLLSLA